ncbi:MAG: SDR family NAD(P)-dependent oxidoreductase [Candidatus Omnitrophica bacterium]|nr:SDR family NAD(P)-dependent oxidoreductase [Candidatus Omnitrophota bacterium]
MFERVFNLQDQEAFARLSGDYNKLHLDAVAARRYLSAGPVVHGMHMVLWALDRWLQGDERPRQLISLKVSFIKSLGLGQAVTGAIVDDSQEEVSLKLNSQGQLLVSIRAVCKSLDALQPDHCAAACPMPRTCKSLGPDEVMNARGEVPLGVDKDAACRLFPNLLGRLPLVQVSEMLGLTRIVGMECPGLHSLLSGVDVVFGDVKEEVPVLKYQSAGFRRGVSLMTMAVEGACVKGAITAFLRPAPARQMDFSSLRDIVGPDEFKGQHALIIGGSRGLGEITAKLLAAGGARVLLTYARGREDAFRVVDEINSLAGRAEALCFDILDPGGTQAGRIADFSPTHLYYFATPPMTANRGAFSSKLFNGFSDYYVTGFSQTLEFVMECSRGLTSVFYPSSDFIDKQLLFFVEFVKAKIAGEVLCSILEKQKKGVVFYRPRLPKMATDQTASIIADHSRDPVPMMLEQLRRLEAMVPQNLEDKLYDQCTKSLRQ